MQNNTYLLRDILTALEQLTLLRLLNAIPCGRKMTPAAACSFLPAGISSPAVPHRRTCPLPAPACCSGRR